MVLFSHRIVRGGKIILQDVHFLDDEPTKNTNKGKWKQKYLW